MKQGPLVSVVFVSYQQAEYVEAALESLLTQDYENLEILIFDDFSRDGTLAKIQKLVADYEGPHEIYVHETDRNRGLVPNLNRAFARCRGELVVLAAGDDVSRPDRVRKLTEQWEEHGRPPVVTSRFPPIDEESRLISDPPVFRQFPVALNPPQPGLLASRDLVAEILKGDFPCVMGAAAAYSREFLESFPALPDKLVYEDRLLCFRGALTGGILYVDEDLVNYRLLSTSLSSRMPGLQLSLASIRERILRYHDSSKKFRIAYESMRNEMELPMIRKACGKEDRESLCKILEEKIELYRLQENWWSLSWSDRIKNLKEGPFRSRITAFLNMMPFGAWARRIVTCS